MIKKEEIGVAYKQYRTTLYMCAEPWESNRGHEPKYHIITRPFGSIQQVEEWAIETLDRHTMDHKNRKTPLCEAWSDPVSQMHEIIGGGTVWIEVSGKERLVPTPLSG